ncbi:MAG: flippase-like domain-containing protein [candidate division Zixibacteria bacterium]|nr:flippase-like domain-containing protein [candidate division Zixibacteria bacterium]
MIFKKKQFWGSLIAIALLAFCLKNITLEEMKSLSLRIDYVYLIPAVICTFAFYIFRAVRWRLMVSQQKPITIVRSILLYSAGQILNAIMPALTGQVGRMFLFAKKEGLKKTFVFSTIVLEVVFDTISLILLLLLTSVSFVFPEKYRFGGAVAAGVMVVVIIILYLILHYQRNIEEFSRRHLRDRRPGVYITAKKFIRSFTKGIEMLRSSQHLVRSMIFSLMQWLTHILAIYFLMRSFGFGLSFASAVAVMLINQIAIMIPITPGNAGTFEIVVSTSLAAFSVGSSDAVLFALALHILDLFPIFVLGYIFLHKEKVSIAEIKARHEDESVLDRLSEDGTLIDGEEQT